VDNQGNASLIVLMQNIEAQVGKEEVAKDAVTPKEWAIFSKWELLTQDRGKEFSQVVQLLWPDGKVFKQNPMKFRVGEKRFHENRLNVLGFPIGQQGEVKINMWLEEDSVRVGELHSYILFVSHSKTS
jgi:hypothetical protein